jgi:hypothetical protein
VIFIEAGVRPREWIGVMTALYFLHELVEHHYEFDAILDAVDIVVVPVANPGEMKANLNQLCQI